VKAVRKNVTDRQTAPRLRLSCRNFLQVVVAKLLKKTAVQYALVNNRAFLYPRLIANTDKNKARLKSVLHVTPVQKSK